MTHRQKNNQQVLKVVVTTVPFGAFDPTPMHLLENAKLNYLINPLGRKLRPEEVANVIGDADIVIAGTEPITTEVLDRCPNLKSICRVGIGLDNVDLIATRDRNIGVSYTPDGPSPAVAELTIGLMIDLLREITKSDRDIRNGFWFRQAGRRLSNCTVGIIGCGRIGGMVINHLNGGFPGIKILANDIRRRPELDEKVTWSDKKTIYEQCDVISVHVPLTTETKNMITALEISLMSSQAVLLNTARGGVINEMDILQALEKRKIKAAAIDTFEEEPYQGDLRNLEHSLLTCHLGSMTQDCRSLMEVEATQEAIRFARGEAFKSPVPQDDYDMAERLI